MNKNKKIISLISILITLITVSVIGIYAVRALSGKNKDDAINSAANGDAYWAPGLIGLKISVFNNEIKQQGDSKIVLSDFYSESLLFDTYKNSKMTGIHPNWGMPQLVNLSSVPHIKSNTLYSYNNGANLNRMGDYTIKVFLENNNYANLKKILQEASINDSRPCGNADNDNCYIVVEPMISIEYVIGTLYEFYWAYDGASCTQCKYISKGAEKYSTDFNTCYATPIGIYKSTGGVLWNNIYAPNQYIGSQLINERPAIDADSSRKATCAGDQYCSAGMGIYNASTLFGNPGNTPPGSTPNDPGKTPPNANTPPGSTTIPTPGESNYDITVTKVKKDGTKITSGQATFNVYKSENCSGTPTKYVTQNGSFTISDVSINDSYSIREEIAPSGYVKDSTCYTISKGQKSINIVNKTECEYDFDKYGQTMSGRISLYLNKYNSYNNLLDFNIKDGTQACTAKTTCNKTITKGCLSAYSSLGSFSESDLSCYSETITFDGKTGFCGTQFELSNTYGSSLGSTIDFDAFVNYSKYKAGQMVINKSLGNNLLSTGELTKKCYVYPELKIDFSAGTTQTNWINHSGSSYVTNEQNSSYSSYVGNYTLNNRIISPELSSSSWETYSKNGYYELTKTYTANYNAQAIYAENGSGILHYSPCDNCKLLGYGYAAPLNAQGKKTIPFEIDLSKLKKGKINNLVENSKGTCIYSSEKIITTPNDELNLLYRIIDTSSPFPGRFATGRTVGWNWQSLSFDYNNDGFQNEKDLDILSSYIKGENALLQKNYPECNFSGLNAVYGDINSDGKVEDRDRTYLAQYLAGWDDRDLSCQGLLNADVNLDGKITSDDRYILANYLADHVGYSKLPIKSEEFKSEYDLNRDGLINNDDLNYAKWVIDNYGNMKYDNTKSNNPLIKYIMETTNNSRNKDEKSAKYKILLTQKDIQSIREYNDSTKYDDYDLKCINGYECKSTFLENLKKGTLYKPDGNFIGNVSVLETN